MKFTLSPASPGALAALAALGLAALLPATAHAQIDVTVTGLTVDGVSQPLTGGTIVRNGQQVVFTSEVTNTSGSPISTIYGGSGGFTFDRIDNGPPIAPTYTVHGSPGGLLAGQSVQVENSFTVDSGTFGTYIGSPYEAFTLGGPGGINSYESSPTSLTLVTPEPSSVAAFAFTGLGAAGLILRARKRKSVS